MECSNCPLFKFASKPDLQMTIRRQEKHEAKLKFVLDYPDVNFFVSDDYVSLTKRIFQRFIKVDFDIVFTKNCAQAMQVKGVAMDRKARACCEETFAQDITGGRVIVACGNTALEALGYKGRKWGNSTGWVDYNEGLGASVMACKDPHELEESPGDSWKDFLWTIQRAEKIVNGLVPDRNILPEVEYTVVSTVAQFEELAALIADGEYVECDIETGGLDFLDPTQEILMTGLHHPLVGPLILTKELTYDPAMQPVFNSFFSRVKASLHNSKFDTKFLEHKLGISVPVGMDTLVLHQLIDERTGTHGLERLVRVYLNWCEYWENLKQYVTKKDLGYREVPFDILAKYLAYDLVATYELRLLFTGMLRDDREKQLPWEVMMTQWDHYNNILVPVNNALRTVERLGTEIDEARLDVLIEDLTPRLDAQREDLQTQLLDLTGAEYSVDSPAQLLEALHRADLIPSSVESVDKNILGDFAEKVPFIKELLSYKKDYKVLTTYYLGSKSKSVLMGDGSKRLFPTFSLVGTIGSRWSSSKPNFQQVPRKGPYKGIFIPREGRIMFEIDFSGLEARIAAWLSGDKALAAACVGDLHQTVAHKVFVNFYNDIAGLRSFDDMFKFADSHPMLLPTVDSLKEYVEKGKTEEEALVMLGDHLRSCAKPITFGIFFGRGARALAEQELMCSVTEAYKFIDEYFKLFPDLYKFIQNVHKLVREEGIVIGPDGRIRDLRGWMFSPDVMSQKKALARAERQAVNNLTQGTAGTVNNIAFFRSCDYLEKTGVGRVKGAVHDSIIGELDFNNDTVYHLEKLTSIGPAVLKTNIITFAQDVKVGKSWGGVSEVAKFYKSIVLQ